MTGMPLMGEGCPAACPGAKKEIKSARQEANAAAAERKVRGNASLPHKNRAVASNVHARICPKEKTV